MKKMFAFVLAAALLATTGITASARACMPESCGGQRRQQVCIQQQTDPAARGYGGAGSGMGLHTCGQGNSFVDADGDGICDNCGQGNSFVDADGDGICDHRGNGNSFVDADGDGICDHRGQGNSFVDADGDGVCDNRPSGSSAGGSHRGGCHGGRGRRHC